MTKTVWPELGDKEVRYSDRTWELTGDVEVLDNGETLAVDVVAATDVRHGDATLYFSIVGSPGSLNPGNLGDHFDSIERRGRTLYLTVNKEGRTCEYRATRIVSE